MTGKLSSHPVDSYRADKHDHLVIFLESMVLVYSDPRMFGKIRFEVSRGQPPEWWRELPPEVSSAEFTKGRVHEFAGRRAKTPVKTLLLEQSVFPGIGNWMADEICWRLGWHPARRAGTLSERETAELWKVTRLVARQALRVIGDGWKDPPRSMAVQPSVVGESAVSAPRMWCGIAPNGPAWPDHLLVSEVPAGNAPEIHEKISLTFSAMAFPRSLCPLSSMWMQSVSGQVAKAPASRKCAPNPSATSR